MNTICREILSLIEMTSSSISSMVWTKRWPAKSGFTTLSRCSCNVPTVANQLLLMNTNPVPSWSKKTLSFTSVTADGSKIPRPTTWDGDVSQTRRLINGISTTNLVTLNWWVDRFLVGTINSWKVGHMDPVNWASGRHVQRLIWIPFHHVGHLMGKWCSSFWLDRKIMSKKQHMIRYPGVFEQQITILKVIYFRIYSWYIFLSKYYIYGRFSWGMLYFRSPSCQTFPARWNPTTPWPISLQWIIVGQEPFSKTANVCWRDWGVVVVLLVVSTQLFF